MKLVVQRVSSASVANSASGKLVGKIKNGLFVLVGVKNGDSIQDAELLSKKISKLRVMADTVGKMNLPASEILVVSQFTLYADTKKGNRPSFVNAANPESARYIYNHFVASLKATGVKVATGSFGDYMTITAVLDGPVTIILEN